MSDPRRRRPRPRPTSRWFVSLTITAAAALAGAARADPPLLVAPLGGGTPGPIRALFLDPTLADARAVGQPQLLVRLESANSWSVPVVLERGGRRVSVQLDAQADALLLGARLPWSTLAPRAGGWPTRVVTTLGFRVTELWGGFEDGGIEAWHRLVGAYNFRRNRYPRDHLNLTLSEPGATAFDLRSARLSAGDLVIGHQVLLAAGGATASSESEPSWGVSARLDLKLPTGSLARVGGSGHPDAGVALLATVELSSWAVLHGMVFGTVTAPFASRIDLQPRTLHGGLDTSLVLHTGSWAFILEDRLLSPLLEGGWTVLDGGDDGLFLSSPFAALFRAHNQITVGVRYGPAALSFSEDFTPGPNPRGQRTWFYNSNAPDTVLALTVAVGL